jgi:hypothetical protein
MRAFFMTHYNYKRNSLKDDGYKPDTPTSRCMCYENVQPALL